MRLPRGLRSLAHADFRVYMAGQGISQAGTWIQMIATSWLVYRLSDSPMMLGLSAFALQVPYLLISPVAGVFVDRWDVRRMLAVTNTIALVQAMAMAALVATGRIEAWHIVLANLVQGVVSACDVPGRYSLIGRLVPRSDLANAIALNGSIMNGARFVGPMIGGALIAALGEAWGFATNSAMRLAVLAALLAMAVPPREAPAARAGWRADFVAGLRYAWRFLPARYVLLLTAVTSFFVQTYFSLMPWFAKERFAGGSNTLGQLLAAAGVGALVGIAYLAARPSVRGLYRLAAITAALAGAGLTVFSFAPHFGVALAAITVVGLGMMLTVSTGSTVLQTVVPDELRGRIASLQVMAFVGVAPLGALVAGAVAERIGPPSTLAVCGAAAVGAAAVYARQLPAIRKAVRPVYERLGL